MMPDSRTEYGPWVAVVNHGRWIAECPRPRCQNALGVDPGTDALICQTAAGDGCGYAARVEWPQDAAAIITELVLRPVHADRNWAPAGHRQTHHSLTVGGRVVAEAHPNGQTVADLRAENRELEAKPRAATGKDELVVKANDALAALGFAFDPDTEKLRRL
jgi:hypothetical protein